MITRLSAVLTDGAAIETAPLAWVWNRWGPSWMVDAVTVGVGLVLRCIVGLVTIALPTIATQTVRASRVDPIRVLHSE